MRFIIIVIIIPSNYKKETKETSHLLFALVGGKETLSQKKKERKTENYASTPQEGF